METGKHGNPETRECDRGESRDYRGRRARPKFVQTHSLDLEETPAEESVSDNILDDAFTEGRGGEF